jgi:hypothetical protein
MSRFKWQKIFAWILMESREIHPQSAQKICAVNCNFFALRDLLRYGQRLKHKTITLQFCSLHVCKMFEFLDTFWRKQSRASFSALKIVLMPPPPYPHHEEGWGRATDSGSIVIRSHCTMSTILFCYVLT